MADRLFDPNREPEIDPRDAVIVVHRFLERCRRWATEREIPSRLDTLRADPTAARAASLHAWASFAEFIAHAQAEVERGDLDPWFRGADEL